MILFLCYVIKKFGQFHRCRREQCLQSAKHHTDAFRQVITGLHDVIAIHLEMKNIDKAWEGEQNLTLFFNICHEKK